MWLLDLQSLLGSLFLKWRCFDLASTGGGCLGKEVCDALVGVGGCARLAGLGVFRLLVGVHDRRILFGFDLDCCD